MTECETSGSLELPVNRPSRTIKASGTRISPLSQDSGLRLATGIAAVAGKAVIGQRSLAAPPAASVRP